MLTDNILELIGNTPLLQLKGESVFAKAEFLNPGGSIKDRVAVAMLEAWGLPSDIVPKAEYLGLVRQQNKVLHDAWLAHVGHERPMGGKKPPTLEEALVKAAELEEKIAAAK